MKDNLTIVVPLYNEEENIEIVSMKAQAGYTGGYADPEFIKCFRK